LTASASNDVFIVKYTSAGGVQWITRLASSDNDIGNGICSTTDGGICVSGRFISLLTAFNASSPNTSGFATTLTTAGNWDTFIVKYSSSGLVMWVTRIGGTGNDYGEAICSTPDGGICVTGWYDASSNPLIAYNSDTTSFFTTLPSSGSRDAFIVKYY
jgi:hypothetical protein